MKYYLIADTHFHHHAIIEYCNRPKNYELLLKSALEKIKSEDCLIHLGDIGIGGDARFHAEYIEPLVCKKILVKGNHDTKTYSWYCEHGWDFVVDDFHIKYDGNVICFSHKPRAWDGQWDINIHGHLHNLGHRDNEYKPHKKWNLLFSAEEMNYNVVELRKFISMKVKQFYKGG